MKQPFWNSFPLKTSNHICTAKQKLDSFQLAKNVNVICKTDSHEWFSYAAVHSSNVKLCT